MSELKKGNVMEELEKNGIDVTATLDNIIKKFPDLIVYAKADSPANERCEKTEGNNTAAEDCGNKEQEFHKPDNNCKESADSNKCDCNCGKCENEDTADEEQDHPCHIVGCVFGLDHQTALMLNILEDLSAINDNICSIGRMLEKNSPTKVTGTAELKTCKIRKGVSKKQMANMLERQKDDIYDIIVGAVESRMIDLEKRFEELIKDKKAKNNK